MVRRLAGLGSWDLRNSTMVGPLASPHPKDEGNPNTEPQISNLITEGFAGYSSQNKIGDTLTTKEYHQSPTRNGQKRHSPPLKTSLSVFHQEIPRQEEGPAGENQVQPGASPKASLSSFLPYPEARVGEEGERERAVPVTRLIEMT